MLPDSVPMVLVVVAAADASTGYSFPKHPSAPRIRQWSVQADLQAALTAPRQLFPPAVFR
jgi:hypothetical protein